MQPHQRIALALRVARVLGAEVQVSPYGGGLYFYVPSPVDARVAAALVDAGFAPTPLARIVPAPSPFVPPYGPRGWETTCGVPGYRATEFLLSLDGEGALPERAARTRPGRKRAPRPRAPRPQAAPAEGAGRADTTGPSATPVPVPAPDAAALDATPGAAPATLPPAPLPPAPLPPVTVLRAARTRKAA